MINFALLLILAGLVLDKDVVKRILRSDIMRESAIYQDIRQEALEEGLEQGLEQGLERGLEQGLERGLEQGRNQKSQEIAIKLLLKGIAIDIIADSTGLTFEHIQQLQSTIIENQND